MNLKKILSLILIVNVKLCVTYEDVKIIKESTKNSSYEIRFVMYVNQSVDRIKFIQIDDFKEIKFWDFEPTSYKYYPTRVYFSFLPARKVLLDRRFDWTDFSNFYLQTPEIRFLFYFLKGFRADLFRFSGDFSVIMSIKFYISNFISFDKSETPQCRATTDNQAHFQKIFMIIFHYGTKYSRNTCKYLFEKSTIDTFKLLYLSDSFVQRNLLNFYPSQTNQSSLNVKIRSVYLSVFKLAVDKRLLDEHVFEKITSIVFRGEVKSFEPDLFVNFQQLSLITLLISNVRQFFSKGIRWMSSLYIYKTVNMSNKAEIVSNLRLLTLIQTFKMESLYDSKLNEHKIHKPYLYPDEDFCVFVNFPFERLVFLDPQTVCVKNCSCTQYWLLKYVYLIEQSPDVIYQLHAWMYGIYSDFYFNNYTNEIEKCNFKERIKKCEHFKGTGEQMPNPNFQIGLYTSQLFDFANVILIPVTGSLGIIVNIINIIAIAKIDLNKTPEEQQQKTLVRFMLAYSIVNLVYCVIQSLSLISKCVELDSVYCSDLYLTQFAQWFKIICVEFMGNNVKTSSNLIYFFISVNRYILLEKESKLAKFIDASISNWSKKRKAFWIIVMCIIIMGLNSHKIVDFKVVNYSLTTLLDDYYPELFFVVPFFVVNSGLSEHTYSYETDAVIQDKSIVFEVFTYVNFVLNDIVLFLLFTVVDILVLVSFRKSTQKKKAFYKDKLNDAKVQKTLTDMEQAVKKIMRVIIVNSVLLLAIKVFDLFMSVSKFKIWKQDLKSMDSQRVLNEFCHTTKICLVYDEFVKILYMIYYCFSIVCFYFFNKNFKSSLAQMFCHSIKKN